MPKYAYRCNECDNEFEIYHSINDKLKNCESCESVESLTRIPSLTIRVVKKVDKTKVGEVVNSHIEDARRELIKEKEKLKKVTYKPKK